MDVIRILVATVLILFLAAEPVCAQVSEGGVPRSLKQLKSTVLDVVEMPQFNKARIQQQNSSEDHNGILKPLTFAHSFEVNLTVENSGQWFLSDDGYHCWRLKIRSEGAKSLNLIFDQFNIPEQSRLFIFSEKENQVLGAFTSYNNKPSGKFAVAPVMGEEIIVQYETPSRHHPGNDFVIQKVNHDFIGILKSGRRPLGKEAGACNIDVKCDNGSVWSNTRNSVCRMIVDGKELCTGTLINNTKEDQTPYILSASHCYDKWEYAETSVYVFNYESPYCAPLDGDPSNSVSGAVMKAQFDSLDFALTELSLVPPPEYRPYYAGWDRAEKLPDSTVSIHHPQGDIKKISYDHDPPSVSDFNGNYITNGFLKVDRWDEGVTEIGSSGGPLFNNRGRLIGTLTGGLASCSNPIKDFYARFRLAWDYKSDSTLQLKYWLDPENTGTGSVDGTQFYEGEEICNVFTNLNEEDAHQAIPINEGGSFSGYWGGTNSAGITEFMERFEIEGNEILSGISLGIAKITGSLSNGNKFITLRIYDGDMAPEFLIHEQKVQTSILVADAMNYIGFSEMIETDGPFFIGFELKPFAPGDTFAVYQSLRQANMNNHFYYKQDGVWKNFKEGKTNGEGISNVFEVLACNVNDFTTDSSIVAEPGEIILYPNPTYSSVTLTTGEDLSPENVSVYNLIGKRIGFSIVPISSREAKISLAGNVPGIYIVRYNGSSGFLSRKVSFVPW